MGSRIRNVQTTFQAGQVDAKAIGRSDIGIFSQSASDMTNWRMLSTGGIERRQGTIRLADMGSSVRLLPFEFDDDQLFLFALENGQIRIFDTDGIAGADADRIGHHHGQPVRDQLDAIG